VRALECSHPYVRSAHRCCTKTTSSPNQLSLPPPLPPCLSPLARARVRVRLRYIHLEYFHIYRTLWRSQTCAADGLAEALSCPESCDDETPESDCTCTCKGIDAANDNADFDWENLEGCMYASDSSKTILQVPQAHRCRVASFWLLGSERSFVVLHAPL